MRKKRGDKKIEGKDEESNTRSNEETQLWGLGMGGHMRLQSGLAARHSSAQQRTQVCVQNT